MNKATPIFIDHLAETLTELEDKLHLLTDEQLATLENILWHERIDRDFYEGNKKG